MQIDNLHVLIPVAAAVGICLLAVLIALPPLF